LTIPLGAENMTDVNFIGIKIGDLNGSASSQ